MVFPWRFSELSITRKLTLVGTLTSALVLILATGITMAIEWNSFHTLAEKELQMLGAVVGENCGAALAFNDPLTAEETLRSLRVHPGILRAEVFNASQTLFAKFGLPREKGTVVRHPEVATITFRAENQEMEVWVPIQVADRFLGMVAISGTLAPLNERQSLYLRVALGIFLGSLILAWFLAARVSQLISSPIMALAETAKQVSLTRDFSLRGPEMDAKEEVGMLSTCFNIMLAQIQDEISRREMAEMHQARLATAIDQSAEAIIVTDAATTIQYVNPAFEKISGYSQADVIGKTPSLLKSDSHPAAFYEEVKDTLKKGKSWQGHFVNRRKNGTHYEEDVTISPVHSKTGEVIHFVSVHRDVSRELMLKRQLMQSQKLEALGTLAGGVAHDFNNILGAILGFADLARSDLPEGHQATESLQEIIFGARRAQELVRQILAFSRKLEQLKQPQNLKKVVENSIKFIRPSLPSSIEISTQFDLESAPVLIDITQMNQILLNLASNAAHAMGGKKGTLGLRLYRETLGQEGAPDVAGCKPGEYVVMAISDTGAGIPPEIMERLFEPFFTTKAVGEGTGLGLSVVHGIVMDHQGGIRVQSELGKGTTLSVYLPWYAGEVPEETPEGGLIMAEMAGLFKGKALVVDDEPALVLYAKRVLEMAGMQVVGVSDGREGLRFFTEAADSFDLVLTDLTMPGFTGTEMAKAIREINPKVPIILWTGYSDKAYLENVRATPESLGVDVLLSKPVSIERLIKAVRLAFQKK